MTARAVLENQHERTKSLEHPLNGSGASDPTPNEWSRRRRGDSDRLLALGARIVWPQKSNRHRAQICSSVN
jgi:hypothetical protein